MRHRFLLALCALLCACSTTGCAYLASTTAPGVSSERVEMLMAPYRATVTTHETRTGACMRRTVTLRAKHKLHNRPHADYVRLRDLTCDPPDITSFEQVTFRTQQDRVRFHSNSEFRDALLFWARESLARVTPQ